MPPEPTSSSSSYRPAISSPTTSVSVATGALSLRIEGGVQGVFPDRQSFVELGVGEDERRQYADAVRVDPGLEQQESALGGVFDDRRRCFGVRLLARRLLHELDRQHRAQAAGAPDLRPALTPGLHPGTNRLAELSGALANALLLDYVENRESSRLRD